MTPETTFPAKPAPPGTFPAVQGGAQTSVFIRASLVIVMLFVVLRALPILTFPLGSDHGVYLTIGKGLLDGKHLYRDLSDMKPPGIFIAYAGIVKIFGTAAWSAAAADIVLLFVISYLLFLFVEPYLGWAGAAVAVLVHASMHGEMKYFWVSQPETFQLVCVLFGYLLMRRQQRWTRLGSFAAGALLGYACLLKYNAIAFLPFLVLLPYLDPRCLDRAPRRVSISIPWRDWVVRVALVAAGLAAAVAVVMTWVVLTGGWPVMKELEFEVLPRYAAMGIQHNPHYLLSAFARTNYYLGVWNLWAMLAGLLVASFRRDLKRFAPLFLAALSACATVVMQVRFADYYFQTCYPFFAALWAYLAICVYEGALALSRCLKQRGWRLAAGLVWLVFAEAVFWPLPAEFSRLNMRYEELREWIADPEAFYSNYPGQMPIERYRGQFEVLHYLARNAQSSDGVYLWGPSCAIYYLSGHEPPNRFVTNMGVRSNWCPVSWREELVRDLRYSRPLFIVVARHDVLPTLTYENMDSEQFIKKFPQLDALMTQDYRPVADYDSCVIYRRE
jgi:hypothetical protein